MQVDKVIPVLRIFDYAKAMEFYRDWLEFEVEWEHRFEPGAPVYIQLTKNGITLHLSEHHGDGSPGIQVFVWCTGLKTYHEALLAKQYTYGHPGLEKAFYEAWSMQVIDPFGNKITFNEKI